MLRHSFWMHILYCTVYDAHFKISCFNKKQVFRIWEWNFLVLCGCFSLRPPSRGGRTIEVQMKVGSLQVIGLLLTGLVLPQSLSWILLNKDTNHRYLISRLRLPMTSCIVDSTAIYIMVVKFRNSICPPPPQLSLHRRAALPSNSNGTRSVYSRKNPKSSL
jgi:hypothetical protein